MAHDTTASSKPTSASPRPLFHRAWSIALVACLTIVAAAAFTAMPGILLDPLHTEYQWSRGSINVAASLNMIVYGLIAPFAAALMDRFGIRRIALVALSVIVVGAGLTTVMTSVWQLTLYWGLLIGAGTGSLAMTFAATITNNWFVRYRGLVIGALTGASAFGQLVFLPALAWIVDHQGWRPALVTLALTAGAMAILIALVLRDHPADVGQRPYGSAAYVAKPKMEQGATRRTFKVLHDSVRNRWFWLLAASFAVCGATTNGIMWTHFVPAAQDVGMAVTVAASLISMIGVFSLVGTIASGWLSDRFDPRLLLIVYYVGRGLLLVSLPALLGPNAGVAIVAFVIGFGLLDVATVPPTILLCHRIFGRDGAIVFGWINAVHQVGAGAMAVFGGFTRDMTGSYGAVWMLAAALCAVAAVSILKIPHTNDAEGSTSDSEQDSEQERV